MKPLSAVAAVLATFAFAAHAAVGHLAEVSIVDRTTGRELPVHWHQGRAYVVGKPGNEYRISARNRRGEDLLAVVSVDGVDVISGQTAGIDQGGYILAPWSRLDIKGWRKSLGEVASFYFTSLGDSYAARTDRPANVGVIGVALFRRASGYGAQHDHATPYRNSAPREKAEAREHGEMDSFAKRHESTTGAASAPPPSAPLGTGHGRREESHVRYVDFERARTPVETIAIYYDSYRNLLAQGVLAAPVARRDPQPFPSSFAPDPFR